MIRKLFLVVIKSSLVLSLTIQISFAMKREADYEDKENHTIHATYSKDSSLPETPEFKLVYWALYLDIQEDFKILPSIARVSKHWYNCTKQLILTPKKYASATDSTLEKHPHLIFLDLLYNSKVTDHGLAKLPNLAYLRAKRLVARGCLHPPAP